MARNLCSLPRSARNRPQAISQTSTTIATKNTRLIIERPWACITVNANAVTSTTNAIKPVTKPRILNEYGCGFPFVGSCFTLGSPGRLSQVCICADKSCPPVEQYRHKSASSETRGQAYSTYHYT